MFCDSIIHKHIISGILQPYYVLLLPRENNVKNFNILNKQQNQTCGKRNKSKINYFVSVSLLFSRQLHSRTLNLSNFYYDSSHLFMIDDVSKINRFRNEVFKYLNSK
jgi:hypothetical protein